MLNKKKLKVLEQVATITSKTVLSKFILFENGVEAAAMATPTWIVSASAPAHGLRKFLELVVVVHLL